jgi:opacity protein-like surface antigen
MKSLRLWAVLAVAILSAAICAQTARTGPAASGPSAGGTPATASTGKAPLDKDPNTRAAQESYSKILAAYMKSDWDVMNEELKVSGKHTAFLTPAQRGDISYIRTTAPEYRPSWWAEGKKTSNVSFGAKIWGKTFTANYMPSEEFGMEMPVGEKNGQLLVVVSWKPSLLDNPKEVQVYLGKSWGLTRGDLGESMMWHELGHNYISLSLTLAQVKDLYENHSLLYSHLQEFYADMTSLYHCSPHARLVTLMIRIDSIDMDSEDEAHTRAGRAIGSLLLSTFLAEPAKWPSIHFPAAVPDKEIERKTMLYVYQHLDPAWSLAEDKALRELVQKFIMTKGDSVLRSRGEVPLANNLSYKLMVSEDRDLQKKRDTWVAAQLKKAIDAGRGDKPEPASASRPWPFRGMAIEIPY